MALRQAHQLANEIDEGYDLKVKIKEFTKKSDEIKKKLRVAAENEPNAVKASGETVELYGNVHKAKVNLSEDSFKIKEDLSTTDILRVKALLGPEIVKAEEGVKLRPGITLRKVKERLGEMYSELFEDDIQPKFDARLLTAWLKERRKMASGSDAVNLVERSVDRTPNTSKVTFGK